MTAGTTTHPGTLDLERHRRELTGYCYRMLGSAFDAEDAVQETLTRAWRAFERFEGRSTVRTWLYKIASNVCFDMLNANQRRARPVDLGPAGSVEGPIAEPLAHAAWVEPMPDDRLVDPVSDPAEQAVTRDSVRLAFVAAIQYLPPRQRAVLILREVLAWPAKEVADLLGDSVPSVNSALQRARATLAESQIDDAELAQRGQADPELLARYVDAFERYDLESLTGLIAEDATQSMPPYPLWLQGRDDIFGWWVGPGAECRGSKVLPAGTANGLPAFGQYKPSGPNGEHQPWALQVLDVVDDRIVDLTFFLDTERLFPLFGLPPTP